MLQNNDDGCTKMPSCCPTIYCIHALYKNKRVFSISQLTLLERSSNALFRNESSTSTSSHPIMSIYLYAKTEILHLECK